MINQNTKDVIKAELNKQIAHVGSAKKLSVLLNVSNATISNIINDKTTLISDQLWFTLAANLNIKLEAQWMHADTVPFTKIWGFYNEARLHSKVFGLICQPGSGKTYSLNKLISTHKNVVYVKCVELLNTRSFYTEMLQSLGKTAESYSLYDIQQQIVKHILKLENPIIVIDEIERVKNVSCILSQFIDLYNKLEDNCGVVLLGTNILKSMFDVNNKRQKVNWNTAFDRIDGKAIDITPPSESDLAAIMRANGVTHSDVIVSVLNDCQNDNGSYSLRRLKKKVHAIKQKAIAK